MASNKESGIGSRVQNSPATHAYQKDICNRYTSRIHYPMTYSNYPFNVIWGIANVQRDVSYILSVTHSKAPIREITGQTLCEHGLIASARGRNRSFVIRHQSFQRQAVRARARVCGRCATTRVNGRTEGRSSPRLAGHGSAQRAYRDHQLRLSPWTVNCPLIYRCSLHINSHTILQVQVTPTPRHAAQTAALKPSVTISNAKECELFLRSFR